MARREKARRADVARNQIKVMATVAAVCVVGAVGLALFGQLAVAFFLVMVAVFLGLCGVLTAWIGGLGRWAPD